MHGTFWLLLIGSLLRAAVKIFAYAFCDKFVYLESSLMSTLTACLFSPVTPWHGGPPITMSMSPVHHPGDSGFTLVALTA